MHLKTPNQCLKDSFFTLSSPPFHLQSLSALLSSIPAPLLSPSLFLPLFKFPPLSPLPFFHPVQTPHLPLSIHSCGCGSLPLSLDPIHSPMLFPPPEFSHLISLMGLFPWAPVKAALPKSQGPADNTWAKEWGRSTGPCPLMFGGPHSLTQMFPLGTFVFSLQTQLIPLAAPSLARLPFTEFIQVFPHFFSIYCVECSRNPTLTRLPYFIGQTENWDPCLTCFFRGSGLNMVWRAMLLKCTRSC